MADTPNEAPKRVILRIPERDFDSDGYDWRQYPEAIKAYLVWAGREASEFEAEFTQWDFNIEKTKHFFYVQPLQSLDMPNGSFHVVLDMNSSSCRDLKLDDVPHEMYRVRRNHKGDLKASILSCSLHL